MAYGLGSEDEFPDVDVVVRRYNQKTQAKQAGPNEDKENVPTTTTTTTTTTTKTTTESIAVKKEDGKGAPAPGASRPAVAATPLRRRKLGPIQTVDRSLLKPFNDPDCGRTIKARKFRLHSLEDSTETDDTVSGLLDRSPVKTVRKAPRAASRGLELDDSLTGTIKSKARASRRGKYGKDLSGNETSDFISGRESGTDAWNSDEDVFLASPVRGSSLADGRRKKPLRKVSSTRNLAMKGTKGGTPTATGLARNLEQATTTTDPKKCPLDKGHKEEPKSDALNALPKGNLEDVFKKLQIFNDDSESDEPKIKGNSKKPMLERPTTPKKTISASPFKTPKIPLSPWKPEQKEFWDPEVNFAWIDKHSPPKKDNKKQDRDLDLDLRGGSNDDEYEDDGEKKKEKRKKQQQTTTKAEMRRKYGTSPEKRDAKKAFDAVKEELARDFLRELDERITEGKLSQLTGDTGGLRIEWSNSLLTTAGRAHWKCKSSTTTTTSQAPSSLSSSNTTTNTDTDKVKTTIHQHHAYIELASKVLTNEPDLLNTVAHEFCHLAVFILQGKPKMAHGPEFKVYGRWCSQAFGDRGIEVTTKHSYEIEYKYIWRCRSCAGEVKRHSRSVDVVKQRCGVCKGVLAQVKPVPRGGGGAAGAGADAGNDGGGGDGTGAALLGDGKAGVEGPPKKRKQSAWQEFMAREMRELSQKNKGMSFKDRMAVVSAKWSEQRKGSKGLTGSVEVLEIRDDGDGADVVVVTDEGDAEEEKKKGATYDLTSPSS